MFISALLLFATLITHSQIMFQRNYGGDNIDQGTCVVQTDDGGYLVAGLTKSFGVYWQDIYLIKTDAWGDTLWSKRIGKSEYGELPYSMIKTNDNNLAIVGTTSKIISGSYVHEVLLLKFNEYGDTLWYRNYGIYSENSGYDVKQTNDNGFIITGYTYNNAIATSYVLLIKTDENGNEQWMKTYALRQSNGGNSVVQTNDGGYFLAGHSSLGTIESTDCLLIKTNAFGDTIWTKLYGGSNHDACVCAFESTTGDFFIGGNTKSFGNGGHDAFLSKLNATGEEIWMKTYGGINEDFISMILPIASNKIILVGGTKSFGSGERDVYLIKTDIDGNEVWYRTIGGTNDDWAVFVQPTTDNGFILSGYTKSHSSGGFDVYLVKTDSEGISGFEQVYQTVSNIKVFPNPSDGLFQIEFEKEQHGKYYFHLFDINGKLIYSQSEKFSNENCLHMSLPFLSNGIYFLQINGEKSQSIIKILIQK